MEGKNHRPKIRPLFFLIFLFAILICVSFSLEKMQGDQEKILEEKLELEFYCQDKNNGWRLLESGQQGKYLWFLDEVFYDVALDFSSIKEISLFEAEQKLNSEGYKIYTTCDPEIQVIAEEVYKDYKSIDSVFKNDNKMQSGITIVDQYSGDVLASVGGIKKENSEDTINYARLKRNPGTTIIPLTAYAPAIDAEKVTPYTTIPVNINGFQRNIAINTSIQKAINEVGIELLQIVGERESFNFVTENVKLPINEIDRNSIALGTGELQYGVSTEDIAACYAAFANGGIYNKPRTYLWVEDVNGNIVFKNDREASRAMKEETAYLMTEMLNGVVTSGTGVAAKFSDMGTAGKTGTTNNNNDRWFVGYTPYYVAAVWVGKEDNTIINSSNNPACSIWKEIMERIHINLPDKEFLDSYSSLEKD